MRRAVPLAALLCLVSLACLAAEKSPEVELVSVAKIWDAGEHNAFTDLIRFQGRWYCTFREAHGHVGGDGQLRVLVSDDGQAWDSAALLSEKGIDLRDPKLSVTADGRLMIVAGGSVYEGGKTLLGRQPRVAFSNDGHEWTPTQRVLNEGQWLWRVTWHDGRAYGIAYDPSLRAASGPQDDEPGWALSLVTSTDGVHWETIRELEVSDRPNESTIRFLNDGRMMALVRREAGTRYAWIGTSRWPYTDWQWNETDLRFGGPNFIQLPEGSLIAAGRCYEPGPHTILAKMTDSSLEKIPLRIPSSGDNSYPGLVWHDGLLWMSYYASHEGKTSIYLAKIKL